MGVDIIVLNAKKLVDGQEIEVDFDETMKNLDYVVNCRTWGMKWFFYNFGDPLRSPYVMNRDDDNVVNPNNLILGSEDMITTIGQQIGLVLPQNPVEARNLLKKILDSDKEKLNTIIKNLQTMHDSDQIGKAWEFIKNLQMDDSNNDDNNDNEKMPLEGKLSKKIRSLMNYVELAVFFYATGTNGHSIQWSY